MKKIELPRLCRRKLYNEELLALAQQGKNFTDAWKKAAGVTDAPFNALPALDEKQFAAFYKVYSM